jgi:hypothetical protein
MVDESALLKSLRAQCARLDRATLEALTTKGLVRRAQKDFENGVEVALVSTSADTIVLRVADATVEIGWGGITKATCTCPAKEACRHLIIACLWLGQPTAEAHNIEAAHDHAAASEQAGDDAVADLRESETARSFEDLLQLSPAELTKAAGKKVVRQAWELLAGEPACAVDEQPHLLVVTFPHAGQTVRLLSGAGIKGGICSCRASDICAHRVAAVVVYQRAHGIDADEFKIFAPNQPALQESGEAPRSRAEIIASAKALLAACVEIGICHLSPMIRDRFSTLSISALGVNLPRLALALGSLGEGVTLALARDARADERVWLLAAARTFALCCALENVTESSRIDLTGTHRTRYEAVGVMELIGVGAEQWQTMSGYAGLTLLFWEQATQRWYSWSEARPVHGLNGFDPQARFLQEMPWPGLMSPAQAAESRFKLMQARRNYQGRLSGSAHTRALVLGPAEPQQLDFAQCAFRDWAALRAYAISTLTCGLEERHPLRDLVVVYPQQWGARFFDEIAQVFNWQIMDEQGRQLSLSLPFDQEHASAIKTLAGFDQQAPPIAGVLARLIIRNEELALQPITLFPTPSHTRPRLLHLTLETRAGQTAAQTVRPVAESTHASVDDEVSIEEQLARWPHGLSSENSLAARIEFLANELQSLAERGVGAGHFDMSRFEVEAQALRLTELRTLAESLYTLSQAGSKNVPDGILRSFYLLHLCLNAIERSRLSAR